MQDDLGRLVLRVSVGGLLLLHGVHKLLFGIAPIKAMVVAHNIPEAVAYGVYLGEILGPAMMVLGLFARIGAGLVVINMVMAVVLGGMASIAKLDPNTGGYLLELEALYLFGALGVLMLGAGRLSIAGGRFN